MNKNVTKHHISAAQRYLRLSESLLNEAGTPTTALPPSTDATRQMQQDLATTGREGIPAPLGVEPSQDNGETAQGTIDVNGEDAPADIQNNYAKQGETLGMQIPADIKPGVNSPGSNTTDPGSDTSVQTQQDVALAKQKGGTGLRLESAAVDIVAALIESLGGIDGFILALGSNGASFDLAEAIATGEVDAEKVRTKLVELAQEYGLFTTVNEDELDEAAFGEMVEAMSSLNDEEMASLYRDLLKNEGFGDALKRGIQRIRGKGASKQATSVSQDRLRKLANRTDTRDSFQSGWGSKKTPTHSTGEKTRY